MPVTSPACLSFAPACPAPLRELRLSPALPARLYAVRCSKLTPRRELGRFQPSVGTLFVPAAPPQRQAAPPQRLRRNLDPLQSLRGPVCIARSQASSALPAFVNRLCCCRWTLLSQPLPTVESDSAVIPPTSCPAQAPPGRRRLSRSSDVLQLCAFTQ